MDEENGEMIEMEFLGTNEGKKYLLSFFFLRPNSYILGSPAFWLAIRAVRMMPYGQRKI